MRPGPMSKCGPKSTRIHRNGKATSRSGMRSREPTRYTGGRNYSVYGWRRMGYALNATSPSPKKPAGMFITFSYGSTAVISGTAIFGCCIQTVTGNITSLEERRLSGPVKRASQRLELHAGKLARAVLRGAGLAAMRPCYPLIGSQALDQRHTYIIGIKLSLA